MKLQCIRNTWIAVYILIIVILCIEPIFGAGTRKLVDVESDVIKEATISDAINERTISENFYLVIGLVYKAMGLYRSAMDFFGFDSFTF